MGKFLADELDAVSDDLFLYAVFSRGQPNSASPSSQARLCVFSLNEINNQFSELIDDCFQGGMTGKRGPPHIVDPRECETRNMVNLFNISMYVILSAT